MGFIEQGDAELSASINKHWRKVAEYDLSVEPLIVRLQAVDWAAVVASHGARWHREAIARIRAAKGEYGCYCWASRYYNPLLKVGRMIQRYPIMYEGFPIRLCPPEGPPESWGFWFRTNDLKNPGWTPEAHAWHEYQTSKQATSQALERLDTERRNDANPRQCLADRLRSASRRLGKYVRQDYVNANGRFYKEDYELDWALDNALSSPARYREIMPSELGEVEAHLEYFRQCLHEFHGAEKTSLHSPPEFRGSARPASSANVAHIDLADYRVYKRTNQFYWDILTAIVGQHEGFLTEYLDAQLQRFIDGETDLLQASKFIGRLKQTFDEATEKNDPVINNWNQRAIGTVRSWLNDRGRKQDAILHRLEFPETRDDLTEANRPALLKRLEMAESAVRIWGIDIDRPGWQDAVQASERSVALIKRRLSELDAAKKPQPMPEPPKPMPAPDATAPSSLYPEQATSATLRPALLSSADAILGPGFTTDDADQLAQAVGLIDETGKYCLGSRKLGAVVGFALGLKVGRKLTATIPSLTALLAPRWGIQVTTRKTSTGVAKKYFKLTTTALTRLKNTD